MVVSPFTAPEAKAIAQVAYKMDRVTIEDIMYRAQLIIDATKVESHLVRATRVRETLAYELQRRDA